MEFGLVDHAEGFPPENCKVHGATSDPAKNTEDGESTTVLLQNGAALIWMHASLIGLVVVLEMIWICKKKRVRLEVLEAFESHPRVVLLTFVLEGIVVALRALQTVQQVAGTRFVQQ